MRTTFILSFAVVVILSIGCGDSPQLEVATNGNSTSVAANGADDGFVPIAPRKNYLDAKESVNDFLVAVTQGDDKTATSLLTRAAQRETWSNGLALTSDGFPGTQFTIGPEEQVKADETHVETTWVDEQNNEYPCVWLLRKETEGGWRIFAMATKFMEGAPPVVLPFEDHAEMARRQKAAVQQMQQYQRQQVASSPQHQAAQAQRIGATQPAGQNGQIQQASQSTDIR